MTELQVARRSPTVSSPALGDFIREAKDEILRRWSEVVRRRFSDQQHEPEPMLIDHMPAVIDRISALLSRGGAGDPKAILADTPGTHVLSRLAEGCDLVRVIEEYSILRKVISEAWSADGPATRAAEIRALDEAIDHVITASVDRYVRVRESAAAAFNEACTAAFAPGALLERTLKTVLQLCPRAESAAIHVAGADVREVAFLGRGGTTSSAVREHVAGVAGRAMSARAAQEAELGLPGIPQLLVFSVPLLRAHRAAVVLSIATPVAPGFSPEDKALLQMATSTCAGLIAQAELAERAETARMQSEAQSRQSAEFAELTGAMLGHDLRNPLNIITLGASALRASGTLDERQMKNLLRIEDNAQRMARMISDFLDLTRSRLGGGIPILPRDVDVQAVSRNVLEGLEATNPGRQLRLRSAGDCRMVGDPDRIAQVVTNLVQNALLYSTPESPIDVSLMGDGDAVVLEVHNTGPPIPESLRTQLFEPFQRRGQDGKRERRHSAGLGLGLYIVDQIVKAHGGSVRVESSTERGTTFTVRWPLPPQAA